MSYKLFLDDERWPQQVKWVPMPLGPWAVVRDYQAFVRHIERNGLPEFISFDHDLTFEHYAGVSDALKSHKIDYSKLKERTGYACAQWLVNYCLDKNAKLPDYQVHSMNPVGAENIRSLLEQFKRTQQ